MSVYFRIAATLLLFLFVPISASAHELKTDGSIGAVLHVSPDDDPIIGAESGIFFELKDKKNSFKPAQCECTGSVLQNGKEIYSQQIFQGTDPSFDDAAFFYTFPKKNVYTVRLSGKPTTPGSFEPFVLDWDIRVERESTQNTQGPRTSAIPPIVWYVAGGLILLVGLIGIVLKKRRA